MVGHLRYLRKVDPTFASWPTWRQAMAANTWAEVGSNTLADIDPENDAAVNPNYPSEAPWHGNNGQASVIDSWCGAAWDEANRQFHIADAGGHQDYGGNEHYRTTLGDNSPAWSMLRAPTGAVGNTGTLNDGNESTGVYFDGKPRPVHPYNYKVFVPGLGIVIVRLIGPYPGVGTVNKAFKFGTDGTVELLCDYADVTIDGSGPAGGAAAYDSSRNCIWFIATGTAQLCKLDLGTLEVTQHGTSDNHHGNYVRLVYLSEADALAAISSSTAGYVDAATLFSLWNLTDFSQTARSFTGSFSDGFTLNGQAGCVWDGSKLLLWDNTTNTTEISTLTPGADYFNDAWVAGKLTVDASNTVTPSARATNGTYGRFFYSASLGGCGLLNAVGEPIDFFATE